MILVGLLEALQNLLEGLRIEIIEPRLFAFQHREFARQLALWNTLLIFLVERLASVQGPIPNESGRARHTQQFVRLKCRRLHSEFVHLALLRHSFASPRTICAATHDLKELNLAFLVPAYIPMPEGRGFTLNLVSLVKHACREDPSGRRRTPSSLVAPPEMRGGGISSSRSRWGGSVPAPG